MSPRITTAAVAGGAWGVLLTARPERLMQRAVNGPVRRSDVFLCRILGLRHVVEAVALLVRPQSAPVASGVEALHALTMTPVALTSTRLRRAAGTSAGVAAILGTLTAGSERSAR